jgi:hypothetical protein
MPRHARVLEPGDLRVVLQCARRSQAERNLAMLKQSAPPHRAGPDAERLCGALRSLVAD